MIRFIIAIISVGIAAAVFFIYTKPAYDSSLGLQKQILEYDQALEKATELQRLKQDLERKFNSFSDDDKDRLHKLLPDHVDNVRLILDLDNLASSHGFALQNVVVSSSAPQGTESAQGVIGASSKSYDSLTFSFATSGTYSEFIKFMTSLERSLRIVDLVSLSLNPVDAQAAGIDLPEPLYSFDVTIRTYWLK